MKVGFTGTRVGMTDVQLQAFVTLMGGVDPRHLEFHHGDCVGSDEQAHDVLQTGQRHLIVLHPGRDRRGRSPHRAYCSQCPTPRSWGFVWDLANIEFPGAHAPILLMHSNVTVLGTLPYLVRNRRIVDSTDLLIATPNGFVVDHRSGTWSTILYAARVGKRVLVIWPDGRVCEWPPDM